LFVNNENFVIGQGKIAVFVTKFVGVVVFGCELVGKVFEVESHFGEVLFSDGCFAFGVELLQYHPVFPERTVYFKNISLVISFYLIVVAVPALVAAELLIGSTNKLIIAM
jgi:hypothetical protein